MAKKISIIIPTLNEANNLPHLLADLSRQQQVILEIIVVDGGSIDRTCQIVKQNQSARLCQTHRGVGHQRNMGGQKATGDYLFFIDADVRILDPNFIYRAIEFLNQKQIDIACPYYWPFKSTWAIKIVYLLFNSLFFIFQRLSASGAGSGIITTSKLFGKVGGFNSNLTFDDIDFIRRGARLGRFAMLPQLLSVSDRRFRKYGVVPTFVTYLLLSFFFITNQFKAAEIVPYQFGNYSARQKNT